MHGWKASGVVLLKDYRAKLFAGENFGE